MAEERKDAKNTLERVKEKFLHSNGLFFTWLRSSASSQVCGWIDMLCAFLAFSVLHLSPFLSTATGAFIGGVFNCIINYKFTFHAYGVQWRVAFFKFAFVWTGSMLLNSYGTQAVYYLVKDWHWLQEQMASVSDNGTFVVARLSVALTVSICWNFLLQRNFVFKPTRIDPYIGRFLDIFRIRKSDNHDNDKQEER